MSARRKNSANRRVRRTYDQDALTRILTLPEADFGAAFGMQTVDTGSNCRDDNSIYHYRDNGSRVLAVAHLDTVVRPKDRVPRYTATSSGPHVVSGALDDRLGAYVILDLLPKLGITNDWLLTTGEEQGQSTAGSFTSGKEYDWVIEFDRGGTDVVMYQYDNPDARELVQASGATMGYGSFSDIAYMDSLGVQCFNWGVGYQGNYHSPSGHAYLCDTFAMVARYLRFSEQNAGKAMPYEPDDSQYGSYRSSYYSRSSYSTSYSYSYGRSNPSRDEHPDCDVCGAFGTVDPDTLLCGECSHCWDCTLAESDCRCRYSYSSRAAAPARTRDSEYTVSWDEYMAQRPGSGTVYNEDGYNQYGHDRDGYDRDGYNCFGRDSGGFNRAGVNALGRTRAEMQAINEKKSRPRLFVTRVYGENGYDQYGYDRDGYDQYGRTVFGYDQDGYNKNGRDRFGRDRDGYDENGYSRAGYDRAGYDNTGYDRDGYDTEGYDDNGFDIEGYDADGYSARGRNREGKQRPALVTPRLAITAPVTDYAMAPVAGEEQEES